MRFGIGFANTGWYSAPEGSAELAKTAERVGFESLWTVEHVVVPSGYESRYPYSRSGKMAGGVEDFSIPDPLVWLASLIHHTRNIRLATGVLILPLRNPVVLAKAAATLDHLSGGRVILGIGSGWLAEEFSALGIPFADRGDRTDDAIRALRALWTQERATHRGSHFGFEDVYLRPQPAQRPIPIVVGGHSVRAARRAGELGDGFFPGKAKLEDAIDLMARARRHAAESGRDPDALEFSAMTGPDRVSAERRLEAGVDRVVVMLPTLESVEEYAREVIQPLGGGWSGPEH